MYLTLRPHLMLLAPLFTTSVVSAQPYFQRTDIPVNAPIQVVAGDFNGDDRADLFVASSPPEGIAFFLLEPKTYEVYLNQGSGTFAAPVQVTQGIPTYYEGQPLFVADFNQDGNDDVLAEDGVLLSRGDGNFVLSPLCCYSAGRWRGGDFNGDGKPDILHLSGAVMLGNGDGTFREDDAYRLNMLTPFGETIVADVNNDGRGDVIFAPPTAVMNVYLAQPGGGFGSGIETPLRFLSQQRQAPFFLPADINGDSRLDLSTPSGVLLGGGDGTFHYADDNFPDFPSWLQVAAGDVTGDAYADVILRENELNDIVILKGSPEGRLSYAEALRSGTCQGNCAYSIAIADWNGDALPDLAAVNPWANILSMFNASATASPAQVRSFSATGYTTMTAPGSLASLYTSVPVNTSASAASSPWPTALGGITLTVRDSAHVERPAPLLYVSPTQINFQVPPGTATGDATLTLMANGQTTEAGSLQVSAVAPAILTVPSSDSYGPSLAAANFVRVEPDGTQTILPAFACNEAEATCEFKPIPLSSANGRPIYLSLFGTGFNGANTVNVKATTYGGLEFPVTYAGAQGVDGLDQINIRLTTDIYKLIWGEVGDIRLTVFINGVASNIVWFWIE